MMVCALATKKEESLELNDLEARLSSLKEGFLHLAEKDEEAFTAVMAAYRLPREDERRRPAIEGALLDAAEVPLKVASDGVSLLSLLVVLVPLGTRQSVSDVGGRCDHGEGSDRSGPPQRADQPRLYEGQRDNRSSDATSR